MIKVSAFYPNTEGSRFDIDYYVGTHVDLAKRLLAPALINFAVDFGIDGGLPDSKPPYHAIGHLTFESVEAFYEAFVPVMTDLQGDIPNYTDVQAVIQISEVKIP
jgi:uncharacterized protein (TIGR02118 family)